MTYAILLDNAGEKNGNTEQNSLVVVSAAQCDPDTGQSSLVRFPDGTTDLDAQFHVTPDTQKITLSACTDAEPDLDNKIIGLTVDDETMALSMTGEVPNWLSIETLLNTIFQTVLETDETAKAPNVVFVGTENPIVEKSARAAGFAEVDFLLRSDAALREWEHVRADEPPTEVVILKCAMDGSVCWELRCLDDYGNFVPDPSKCGRFVPTGTLTEDETRLEPGLNRFLAWAWNNHSRHVVITGSGSRTAAVADCASALEFSGYEIFVCSEPVLGASKPPTPCRYHRVDEIVEHLLAAQGAGDFDDAIAALQNAKAIFPSPPAAIKNDISKLTVRLRNAILSDADETQNSQQVDHLSQQALLLSETDCERAQVYLRLVENYSRVGNSVAAEAAAITAQFLDPKVEGEPHNVNSGNKQDKRK